MYIFIVIQIAMIIITFFFLRQSITIILHARIIVSDEQFRLAVTNQN